MLKVIKQNSDGFITTDIDGSRQVYDFSKKAWKLTNKIEHLFKTNRAAWDMTSGRQFDKACDNSLTVLKAPNPFLSWKKMRIKNHGR